MDHPSQPENKFNLWCQRIGLTANEKQLQQARSVSNKKDFTPVEKSSIFFHELTGCNGIEFVAFSSIKLPRHVPLSNEVMLVPCFVFNLTGVIKTDNERMTATMQSKARYVYDGWIPLTKWGIEDVRDSIKKIDDENVLEYKILKQD